jgi:hypothetical protein
MSPEWFLAASVGLRRADVDEVVDQLEVARVMGEQGDVVHIGGCGDGEIERAPAVLSSPPAHCGCQSSPFARDGGVDRQWLEGGLDDSEAQAAASAFVFVGGDQDAEVQLGQAGGADGAL